MYIALLALNVIFYLYLMWNYKFIVIIHLLAILAIFTTFKLKTYTYIYVYLAIIWIFWGSFFSILSVNNNKGAKHVIR